MLNVLISIGLVLGGLVLGMLIEKVRNCIR